MTAIERSTATPPSPWRPHPGESVEQFLHFVLWLIDVGPVVEDLAQRYQWAHRRKTIETFEALNAIPAKDVPVEAAIGRVQIVLAEILKLRAHVMSTPENVLDTREIMQGIDWLLDAQQGMLERAERAIDWSKLTPAEREIMIQAADIQDRLLGDVG